jgi:hypothetical protein
MLRSLPLLAGLLLVTLAGLVHGVWTGRWEPSRDLEEAAARVQAVPLQVGDWQGEGVKVKHDEFAQAGAVGYWMRLYRNTQTGEAVTVLLMCGPAGKMSVHTPDLCYGGVGYEVTESQAQEVVGTSRPADTFWSARFRKAGPAGESALRIRWAWSADGTWQAPEGPRWTFAGAPFLYKLYIVSTDEADGPREGADANLRLLRALLPELRKTLFPPSGPPGERR